MTHRKTTFSLVFAVAATVGLLPVHAERWTSLHTSRTVEADFIGVWGDSVVLELPGQRRVTVKLDDLVAESRIKARQMGEQQSQRRQQVVEGIEEEAREAAAPAPNPIPKPPSAPTYQRLSSSGSLLEQLEWLDQQSRNGHLVAASFDMLPPTYQSDLERLLRASAAKVDTNGLNAIIGSVHSVGDMVVTRQRWMFSHPRFKAMDPTMMEPIEEGLLAIAGMIRDGFDPAELGIQELQTMPLRDWLLRLDERLAPYLVQLSEMAESVSEVENSFAVLEEKDDKATVEITSGEIKRTLKFQRVEGYWVPEETAASWTKDMEEWEKSLESVPDGSLLAGGMAAMIPGMIDPVLQPALTAETARDFHAAMDSWFAAAGPLVAMAGQQLGQLNLGGRRGGSQYGGYDDGYDDMEGEMSYEEMMEMEMEMQAGP